MSTSRAHQPAVRNAGVAATAKVWCSLQAATRTHQATPVIGRADCSSFDAGIPPAHQPGRHSFRTGDVSWLAS